jgi:hypothetical protein
MKELKPITKFCISHKRSDAPSESTWGAFIWAENYMTAWKIAKELEHLIPVVYDITIDGVFLGEIDAGISIDDLQTSKTKSLQNLMPWFIYCQLEVIEQHGEDILDYDGMIEFFENNEEFEICGKLVKHKNSKKEIKI